MPFRILVADDDPLLVAALKFRLESMHYEVITAYDGYQALQKAVSEVPHLLILDVRMPAGSGLSVQHRLLKAGLKIPVIYVTGSRNERVEQAAKALGAMNVLRKPLKMNRLIDDLSRCVPPMAA